MPFIRARCAKSYRRTDAPLQHLLFSLIVVPISRQRSKEQGSSIVNRKRPHRSHVRLCAASDNCCPYLLRVATSRHLFALGHWLSSSSRLRYFIKLMLSVLASGLNYRGNAIRVIISLYATIAAQLFVVRVAREAGRV
jgi:hypothetical protein